MILDFDKYKEIWQTITRNKTRSLLTAFGVFWGIFMFVILMGVGNALQGGMMKGVTPSAKNSMMVFDNKTSVEYKGFNAGRYWNMTTDDAAVIAKTIPEIEYVSASLFMGTQSLVYKDFSEIFNTRGVDENIYFVDTQILLAGRLLNKIDVDQKRKVCVIGKTISEKLFPSYEEAIGKRVSLGGRYYTIVGVATSNSQISMGGRIDDNVLVP
ncbi:MAG: ABC transporter permease, partial [Bacteroidales bacterium]